MCVCAQCIHIIFKIPAYVFQVPLQHDHESLHYIMSPPQSSGFDARKGLVFTVWSYSTALFHPRTSEHNAYQSLSNGSVPPASSPHTQTWKNTQIELTTVNKKNTHTLDGTPPPPASYKSSANGAYPEAGCQDTYVNKEGDYVIYQLSGSLI